MPQYVFREWALSSPTLYSITDLDSKYIFLMKIKYKFTTIYYNITDITLPKTY